MPLLILVAEDDPGIQLAVQDYLELLGYRVVTAKNGDEALRQLETYHPHLIVADIKMPKKMGLNSFIKFANVQNSGFYR